MRRTAKVPTKYRKQVENALDVLSERIRTKRVEAQLTQDQLAEHLEISLETMKAIETKRRLPSLPLLIHICLFLKLDIRLP